MINFMGWAIISIMVWLFTVVMHEFGHYLSLKGRCGQKPQIVYKNGTLETQWRNKLSGSDSEAVYTAGIIFGCFAIVLACVIHWIYIVYALPYIYGCRDDIKKIKEIKKNER